jgi:hypothetical protein
MIPSRWSALRARSQGCGKGPYCLPTAAYGGARQCVAPTKWLCAGRVCAHYRPAWDVLPSPRILRPSPPPPHCCEAGPCIAETKAPGLGDRACGARLFREVGKGPESGRGRAPGRADQGSELFFSRPAPRTGAGVRRVDSVRTVCGAVAQHPAVIMRSAATNGVNLK